MSFLTPSFLLLSLLAIPIIIFYMLRLRRRQILVSSTMLWQKLIRDREANAPWQRLRRNLLLILQLLILALLVLAMARPFLPVPSLVQGNVVVLLDGSASMQSNDVKPDRFSLAKDEVDHLISDLAGDDQMTLILVAGIPQVLASASSDKPALRQGLEDAQARPESADWPSALALAAAAAQGFDDASIVLVSDGGLPDNLPPLPAETLYVPVGESAENLGVSALATRETETGPELFASVTNYGLLNRQALISVDLDGVLFDSRRINVPAGGVSNFTWALPGNAGVITARLSENSEDYFRLDDTAWAVHEGGVGNRALIVTESNRFLETVFSVLPGLQAVRITPDVFLSGSVEEPFELYILDGVALPDSVSNADLLVIDPQPGTLAQATESGSLFSVTGVFSNTNVVRVVDSPLLRFVDWSNVNVRQAAVVDAPWAQPLVVADGGPLLLAGEQGGRRIAIITFRLQDSDLPLQIAFPVLMANITGWLNPGRIVEVPFGVTTGIRPGEPVTLSPGPGATSVVVHKPDDSLWTAEVGDEALLFAETEQLGVYEVRLRDANGDRVAGSFAVNMVASAESDIKPARVLNIGHTVLENVGQENIGQRELWPWLAALAISVLLVEWWIYHRGAQFPRLYDRRIKPGRGPGR